MLSLLPMISKLGSEEIGLRGRRGFDTCDVWGSL